MKGWALGGLLITKTLHEASTTNLSVLMEASCSVLIIKCPPKAHPFINVRRTYTCGVRLPMGMCIHTIACMWNVIQLSPGTSGVSLPLQRRTGIQPTPFPGTV